MKPLDKLVTYPSLSHISHKVSWDYLQSICNPQWISALENKWLNKYGRNDIIHLILFLDQFVQKLKLYLTLWPNGGTRSIEGWSPKLVKFWALWPMNMPDFTILYHIFLGAAIDVQKRRRRRKLIGFQHLKPNMNWCLKLIHHWWLLCGNETESLAPVVILSGLASSMVNSDW